MENVSVIMDRVRKQNNKSALIEIGEIIALKTRMLRIKALKPICVGLLMTFLSACQFFDSSAASWTMINVDAQTFAQGKEVSEFILVEQGHKSY